LRIAVWTGDTRDTRPKPVIGRIEIPQRSSLLPWCHGLSFRYRHQGSLATIGRKSAVADIAVAVPRHDTTRLGELALKAHAPASAIRIIINFN
jgi:hypothetical protein